MFRTNLNLDPIAEMQQWIQFMDQAYNKAAGTQTQQTIIPIDLYEYDNELFVRAAIPGVHPENVNVTVNDSVLTITAEIRPWSGDDGAEVRWFRSELPYGKFTRSVRLPHQLNFEAISAEVADGIVLIRIPGLEALKPKVVQVAVKGGTTSKSVTPKKELAAANN